MIRRGEPADADAIGRLLHDFNLEYEQESPPPEVIAERLRELMPSGDTVVLLAGDPPEALHDGVIDLGAVAIEFLLLGIDPYPRKPGAVFDAPPAGDPTSHPFAALAALNKGEKPKED